MLEVDNSDCGIDVGCPKCGEVTIAPASLVSTGVVVGNDFLILEEIGRGGMGVVYLTHQMSLDRRAALKILSKKYANNSEFVAGFIKEARAAAKLNHPHIVQAYAVGEDNGIYFFAMEHIDGETMKAVVKREGVVPLDPSVTIIQQIAEALDYAWKEQRLIHRDIKPDNIMIAKNGRAKLADLGLARVAGEIDDSSEDEVMGTPQYISPEHLTGSPMDCRSDIYSLGATFYHIITGQFPFTGKSATEIARKHLEEPLRAPKLLNPQIPDSLNRIIIKMMEKNPVDRYQLPEELVEDIRLARRGKSITDGKSTGSFAVRKATGKTIIINTAKAKTGSFQAITTNTGRVSSSTSGIDTSSSSFPKNTKSGTLSTSDMRRMKEKKAMYQVVAAVSACVLAALFAVGYAVFKMKESPKKDTPKTTGEQTHPAGTAPAGTTPGGDAPVNNQNTGTTTKPAEPTKTPYTENADKLLDFAVKNPQSDVDILVNCDDFFARYPSPNYKCDEKSLADILKIYVPLDEKRLIASRKELRGKHLEEMKKREELNKLKLEDEDKKKREEARKEELARLDKEKEDSQKKRIEDYRQDLEKQKENLRFRYAFQSVKRNFADAVKVYDSALQEEKTAPDFMKPEAKLFADWGMKMKTGTDKGAKFWETLANTDKLSGMQIEYKGGSLGKIGTVKDGIASIRTSSGAEIKMPITSLPPRQFKLVTKKMGGQEELFFYYLNCGDYAEAREIAPEDWKSEVSDISYAYLKGKLKFLNNEKSDSAKQEIRELTAKYSSLPEFSRASMDASK
ncbi:MAG: protein kinase [Victivallales bacterium]